MKKVCISKDWIFTGEGKEQNIDLPHDYSITLLRDPKALGGASNGFFGGTMGRYTKYMKLGTSAHTILDIDGAYMCARICFNDNQVAMHPYGYTPYLVDLSDRVFENRVNKIMITVLNVQPSTRWYSGSGIYRDVFLWTGGKVRIEPWDVFVTTQNICNDGAEVSVNFCISADFDCKAEVLFEIWNDGEVVKKTGRESEVCKGKNEDEITIKIADPRLWNCDHPDLYQLKIGIVVDGKKEDEFETLFGIRTVSASAGTGLLLNGKELKLQGGCIHHDHGVLGSAEFPAAVHRKLKLLKEAGYNAVRTAHYPPSLTFLEECDRLGLLVMDEAFDMWNLPKNYMDYSLWFADWWQRDISYMVRRDRNHPSVISYSIGNEIPERGGSSDGYAWARRLADEIRKYDDTRFVTSGICRVWSPFDNSKAPSEYADMVKKEYGSIDGWQRATEKYMEPLDIVGYNYLYKMYEADSKHYPERVIWGSETQVLHFYESWKEVMAHKNVIGDFTWTAYDNLGEAGTGRFLWGEEGYLNGISLGEYPWRSCYQGDFDLCGFRRPQSYFREAIWRGITSPHIFTIHPEHNGDIFSGTGWHWFDVSENWTFAEKFIGKPVTVQVYSAEEEIRFVLNGEEVERTKTVCGIATAQIPYQEGVLTAKAFQDGTQTAEFSLVTVGDAYKIHIIPETAEIRADNRDLCYYDILVEDEAGCLVSNAENTIECKVINAELVGIFSGNPANEDQYGSNQCHVFGGRATAIVKSNYASEIKVIVSGEGLKSGLDDSVRSK